MSRTDIGIGRGLLAGVAFAAMTVVTGAQAADYNVQGFIRQEPAIKLTDEENPYNQQGNIYNGVTVTQDLSLLIPCARCWRVDDHPADRRSGQHLQPDGHAPRGRLSGELQFELERLRPLPRIFPAGHLR